MSSTIPENYTPRTRREPLSPILVVLFLLGAAVVVYCVARELHSVFLHRDPASYLYDAREMLSGVKLYGPQMIETNPPLIFWISMIPVVLASWLHIPVILALKLCVFVLLGVITFWCHSLIRRAGSPLSVAQRLLISLAIPLAVLLTQPDSFGQREQFIVLFFLPYLVAAFTKGKSVSLTERVLMGFLVGLAICLKPFHLCTLAAAELVLIIWDRRIRGLFRTELIVVLITGAAYVAAVRLFTPLYLTDAIPLLDQTFWGFAELSVKAMLLSAAVPLEVLALCGCIAWAVLRRRLHIPLASALLLAAGIGATLAYALQRTTWPYRSYPACVFLYIGLSWLAIDALTAVVPRLLRQGWRTPALWAMTCAAAVVAVGVVIKYQRYIRRHEAPMSVGLLFGTYPAGTTVYELSTGMAVYGDLLQHHLHWGGRYVCLWMLPAIVRNEAGPLDPKLPFKKLPPETVASLALRQRRTTAEDLATERPQVVAVSQCTDDSHCYGLDRNLDIVKWFSADPQFAAEWAHYKLQGTISQFDVYVRTP